MSRHRAQQHRRIEQLETQLENERRRADRYKKRHQRALKKSAQPQASTPRSKTRRLLRYLSVSSDVRKTLLFHNVVVENLRKKYVGLKSCSARRKFRNFFVGRTIQKYKMLTLCQNVIGYSGRKPVRCTKNKILGSKSDFCAKLKLQVKQFYVRDDVSRTTAGKKETVTRKKLKMQKRFILDTVENLHRKFLSENPDVTLSYSLFCRMRPFWVLIPDVKSRETCLCKQHANLEFVVNKLLKLRILQTSNLEHLADGCSCSPKSKACMYGACNICKLKTAVFQCVDDANEVTTFWQWATVKEEKVNKKGEKVVTKVTKKEKQSCFVKDLTAKCSEMLRKFKKHVFNIRHQYSQYRYLKGSLKSNECILHIDFAENYNCKYSNEIQSVHFGASHAQATLHNAVCYMRGSETLTFCTISDSRAHDPPAIWAYLDPVLSNIQAIRPEVNTVHFFSDGPCTQYRQKLNFFFFCTKLYDMGFQAGTWNFSEAGHGKGAADGVGGAVKRSADRIVSLHGDVSTPRHMFDALVNSETTIKVFYVDSSVVAGASLEQPSAVSAIPGTMNIHQLLTVSRGQVYFRDISCFCSRDTLTCSCHSLQEFDFSSHPSVTNDTSSVTNASPADSDKAEMQQNIQMVTLSMIGQFCLVKYDQKIYPGKILKIDENDNDALIQCMSRTGNNRFLWPMFNDTTWYDVADIIALIPEPTLTGRTGRHYELAANVWEKAVELVEK